MTTSPPKTQYNNELTDLIDERFKKLEKHIGDEFANKIDTLINTKIRTSISYEIRQLQSDIISKISDESRKIQNTMQVTLSDELRNIHTNLPTEIDKSLKTILYNNNKFDELFKSYSDKLNTQLSILSTDIIQKVIKDPVHNQVVDGYLKNVSTICNDQIIKNQSDFAKQLTNYQIQFTNELFKYQDKITNEMNNLNKKYHTDFQQLNEGLQTVNTLHQKIQSIESKNTYLSTGLVVLGISNIGLIALKFLRR